MASERATTRPTARTHHHSEFTAAALTSAKHDRGLSISVVIPAREEERTVGQVVGALRETLVEATPLLDEILVVDADSRDATAERARASGAHVVRQSEVLAELGTAPGKGEALWKGLATSRGDLVAFVDADIVDFDPGFVVGLVGPLLADPDVLFTKATYDRPLTTTPTPQPNGGGRVTELLARPLIASFWPELAWLAQPLSGEYAGRRELLESLPFVRGYGVELALLVDIAERHGTDVIAQVDLGRRIHDHQGLPALGRMAAEILHVAMDRLARQDRIVLATPLTTELAQPRRDADGGLAFDRFEIAVSERPPLRELHQDGRLP